MIYHNILENSDLILRALEPSDVEILYNWENNSEEWLVSNTQKPYSKDVLSQYIENSVYDIYTIKQLRLIIELKDKNKTPVGAIDLFDFDPNNRRAGIGILVEKNHRGKNIAKISLDLLVKYAFDVLNVHQLYANITENNEVSMKLFKNCGFEICAFKKDWIRTPEGWLNEYTLQIINNTNIL